MAHTTFPANIPIPTDDGACAHLPSSALSRISVPSTANTDIDIATLSGLTILFCYPRTGGPAEVIPADWNAIPGARGCTPQACSFRDNASALSALGVAHVFGMSTQDSPYQREAKQRLHLPYELLSDEKLAFAGALGLPLFEWKGEKLIKRLTIAIRDGVVVKVWYPVFPPDQSAQQVVDWLQETKGM